MNAAMLHSGVLLLVRDPEEVLRLLPRLLPGRSLTALRREEIRRAGPLGAMARLRALRLDELVMLSDDLDSHEKLWRLAALGALPLAPRRYLLDLRGRRMPLSPIRFLGRDLPALLGGVAASGLVLARTAALVRALLKAPRHAPRAAEGNRICYLRSDLWSGAAAGGSVGHTAGTALGMRALGADLFFVSSATPALIDPSRHPIHLVPRDRFYNIGREVPYFAHGLRFARAAANVLARTPADLLYQRFDPGNCAGVVLARRRGLPLVLEYNGSEVWIADHWDRPFRWRSLFVGLEEANLRHADLIVVVSNVLRDLLLAKGTEAARILVLPNGVDADRYRPDIDGAPARRRLGLQGRQVVGFIGTFGAWHGAPVLARAALRVLRERPEARFLFVGEGPERAPAESILKEGGRSESAVFTGLVPQAEGPELLAAADVLAAPHVPNPDGTRFFGSPTKLFEYMAMGKGIVASRLEQIGEILEDGRTALLVPPGDEAALAAALIRLIDDGDGRARLGAAARSRVLERHTWQATAGRLLERLREMGLMRWS